METAFEIDQEFAYKMVSLLLTKYEFSEVVNGVGFRFSFSIYLQYRRDRNYPRFLESFFVLGVTGYMTKGSTIFCHERDGRTKTEVPEFDSESDAETWFYEKALENIEAIKTGTFFVKHRG